jgi:hypothetical protein
MSEITGVKHTKKQTVCPLRELVDLKHNCSSGGIFRLAKGKSPLAVIDVFQVEETVLIQCVYLKSGAKHNALFSGDKEVVPLKFPVVEDDDFFTFVFGDKQCYLLR